MRGAVGLAVVLAGCYSPSPAVGVPCSADLMCPSGQVCDGSQVPPVCVASLLDAAVGTDAVTGCTDSTQCAAAAPVCDSMTHACRGCVADVECGNICTEYNGQCVPDPKTIFVAPAGLDAGNCTRNSPCHSFGYAMTQLASNRRTIHVADGAYSSTGNTLLSVTNTAGRIVISGDDSDPDGAFLSASSNGTTNPPVVQTGSNTDVVIEGITIRNGGNDGLRSAGDLLLSHVAITGNNGRGVSSNPSNAGALHVWDTKIIGNGNEGINAQKGPVEILRCVVAHNTSGGIFIGTATATVTNTMIVRNGSTGSTYGGLRFQNLNGMPQALTFLTVAYNLANGTQVSGVSSDVTLAVNDSILAENNNASTGVDQMSSGCTASYSLFTTTPPIGTGNVQGSPDFVDAATDDFHLAPTSIAKDAADPAATVRDDIDGAPRPAGGGFDIGADEMP